MTFHGREAGCVIAPNQDEAFCIAHEETGIRPYAAILIPRPAQPLLNANRIGTLDAQARSNRRDDTPR